MSIEDVFVTCEDVPLLPNRIGSPNGGGNGIEDLSASSPFQQPMSKDEREKKYECDKTEQMTSENLGHVKILMACILS